MLMQELIKEANNIGLVVTDFNELNSIKRKTKNLVPILIRYLYMLEKGNYKDAIVGLTWC